MENIATVTAVHRDRYELSMDTGTTTEIFYGRLKAAAFYNSTEIVPFPTVGDRVMVSQNTGGDSLILEVLERKSVFMRLNATQGLPDQAVAANFDYVFITMSCNKDFHPAKLERFFNGCMAERRYTCDSFNKIRFNAGAGTNIGAGECEGGGR